MSVKNTLKRILLRFPGLYRRVQLSYWIRNLRTGRGSDRESRLVPRFVADGDTVIDVGAHFGRYVVPLSRAVGSTGAVWAFEPVGHTHAGLSEIIARLGLANVSLRHAAVSDTAGEMEIVTPRRTDGLVSLSTSHLRTAADGEHPDAIVERVPVVVLDQIWTDRGRPAVSFVKCDVEGAELAVFRGAREIFRACKPTIECEIQAEHTTRFGYQPADLVAWMTEQGYALRVLDDDQLVPADGVTPDRVNYFFVAGE